MTESSQQYLSNSAIRNNKIFAAMYLIIQVLFLFLYGFFVQPSQSSNTSVSNVELFVVSGTGVLVIIGFGLVLSYLKKLAFSGMGFSFLITALTIQFYFLINNFWSRVGINQANLGFQLNSRKFQIYLTDQNLTTEAATLSNAFKCSLAMVIAYSGILGRSGPLQALILTMFGVLIYELNRQLITRYSYDNTSAMSIFCFGGFYGAFISLIVSFKQSNILQNNLNYSSQKKPAALACAGALICWVFFPFLAMDQNNVLFTSYMGALNYVFGVSGAVISATSLSMVINGKVGIKDFIYSPIAGAVLVGASAPMSYSPFIGLFLGAVGGILQIIFNKIQQHFAKGPKFTTNVLFTFGILGLIGGIASSVVRATIVDMKNGFDFDRTPTVQFTSPFNNLHLSSQQLGAAATSMGIGIVSGIIVGLIIMLVNNETQASLFTDATYWIIEDDGISNKKISEESDEPNMSEPSQQIKGLHAYL